jgi:hypothetical protein
VLLPPCSGRRGGLCAGVQGGGRGAVGGALRRVPLRQGHGAHPRGLGALPPAVRRSSIRLLLRRQGGRAAAPRLRASRHLGAPRAAAQCSHGSPALPVCGTIAWRVTYKSCIMQCTCVQFQTTLHRSLAASRTAECAGCMGVRVLRPLACAWDVPCPANYQVHSRRKCQVHGHRTFCGMCDAVATRTSTRSAARLQWHQMIG